MLESVICLWIQVQLLVDLRAEELTLLVDQGLWIPAFILHYSSAKATSTHLCRD